MVRRYGWLLFLLLPACPKPVPPAPTPTPPPVGSCCNVPGSEDPAWRPVTPKPAQYNGLFVDEAEKKLGSPCGAVPDETLVKLAAELVSRNLCAAKWADAVLILRPDGLWEEWHATAYSTGCWTEPERAYIGSWIGPPMRECP